MTKANDDYMCIALDSKVWRATMLSENLRIGECTQKLSRPESIVHSNDNYH